jgi:hypothetical protein
MRHELAPAVPPQKTARCRAGRDAPAADVYKGRPASIDAARVRELEAQCGTLQRRAPQHGYLLTHPDPVEKDSDRRRSGDASLVDCITVMSAGSSRLRI